MVTSVLAPAAASWGVLMGLSPVLQIRQMLREQSSRQVSIGYFVVLLVGFVLWIAYGAAGGNLVLVIPNTAALLVGATVIIVALRLRGRAVRPRVAGQDQDPRCSQCGHAWRTAVRR